MAAKSKPKFNYNAELKLLKQRGPGGLWLLYGPEEYLRERYLDALRQLAVGDGNEFNCRRLNGQGLDLNELSEAVNAMPFFAEGVFVEVRDYDLNRCKDAELESFKRIVSDLPDYCTLAFVQSPAAEPDGRMAAVKALKKLGTALEFTEQDAGALVGWIANRFRALGKQIGRSEAEYLIFLSGSNMNALIPEIEKVAAYAKGDRIERSDVDAAANRLPEADVWAMTDLLSARRYDAAAQVLSDLLGNKDNHPIFLTSLIGQQLRRMYAVRCAQAAGRGKADAMELAGVRYDFIYDKLSAAAKPYAPEQLGALVSLCAEYDYRMKSSGLDPQTLIRELFARIAAGV